MTLTLNKKWNLLKLKVRFLKSSLREAKENLKLWFPEEEIRMKTSTWGKKKKDITKPSLKGERSKQLVEDYLNKTFYKERKEEKKKYF